MKIGLIADSAGDIDALEYACDLLLKERGADKLFFLGGCYSDVDELLARMRADLRGREEYTDADFLTDVAAFVARAAQAEAGGAAHLLGRDPIESFLSRLARVPERDCPQYREASVPRVLVEMVGDRIACLVYDKADLKRGDLEPATFLFYGNSPQPSLVQIGARIFVTPGRLGGEGTRTCGLLELAEGKVEFVALAMDGRELQRTPASLAARHKMTAR